MTDYSDLRWVRGPGMLILFLLAVGCAQPVVNTLSVAPPTSTPASRVRPLSTNTSPPSGSQRVITSVPTLTTQSPPPAAGPTIFEAPRRPTYPPQALTWSPNQRMLAYIDFPITAVETAAERRQPLTTGFLVTLDVDTGQLKRHVDVAVATRGGLAWALDGSQLYFIEGDNSRALAAYDPATATVRSLSVPPENESILYSGDLIILPDEQLVYVRLISETADWHGGQAELWGLDLKTQQEQRLLTLFESPEYRGGPYPTALSLPMARSSDGTRIAFALGNDIDPNWNMLEKHGVYLFDLANLELRRLMSHYGAQELAWSPDDQYLAVAFSIGDGADLWLYELTTNRVRKLSKANWAVIDVIANPRGQSLNSIKLHSLKWAGSEHLIFSVQTWAAGNEFLNGRILVLIYDLLEDRIGWVGPTEP